MFSFLFFLIGIGQAAQMVDRIVGVVNGEIITLQDLQQQIRLVVGQTPDPATAEKIAPQVLDSMIDDIVLRQEAQRLNIVVSDSEVENEVRQFKVRRRLSDEDFERSLRLQGLTPEQFKERSREDIVKHKILGYMVRRKVVVTQEEIDAYLERNRSELTTERVVSLQMVVFADRQGADTIWNSLRGGEIGIDEAVERYSVGPKADKGVMADVNWRELDDPWREGLRTLSVGEVSEPFLIQDRWVIVKLLDRRDGERKESAAVDEEVREAIMRPKLEERFKEYMAGLRSKAIIQKKL
ncbi:MAG: SurA N-terminal domain-containing protein [Desulfomicrobium sp.]|nr:SurA N-terminal domain-containing protein [Pseudomonadota bacterium]MBV1713684.1 SurA N-terminal domain-containing protein [Desulfomicrobium sp.]MBU4572220.1 SurA N-terminal domain-containing protein [Pseudomonadota bacterium]MBU4594198.1 SurA N-terminal domain-containing protein [Pseudomonadota bacterium]MBV1720851.1 SurA N-terminal domain-containing protein [Desulfomicrobium sp.]